MTSLYSPSLGVQTQSSGSAQTPGSSSRPNTAQFVNNSGQVNAQYGGSRQQQLNRWIEEQLKEQEAAAAEKKAAEEAAAAAEQAAAEQAAFEAQKQAYKDDADVVFELESPGFADLSEVLGVDSNDDMFVEVKGDLVSTWIVAGGGNDVIYFGDNQNLFYNGFTTVYIIGADGSYGNDKIFGGSGTQSGHGGMGDDLIDLGDGYDVAVGGAGADQFVIDLQNSEYDLIADFVNVGDKITIFNGGELAQAGDWMLVSVGSEWTGLNPPTSSYKGVHDSGQEFYEIQNADGKTAAIFSAGTTALTSAICELTVQQGVASLEVIESDYGYPITEPSVEFI